MKILCTSFLLLSCVVLIGQNSASDEKQKRDALCLQTLHRIALVENQSLELLSNEIQELDIETLGRLAILARAVYYPGDASTKDYDGRWDQLFWLSLELIVDKSEGAEAASLEALTLIRSSMLMDASHTRRLNAIEERIVRNKSKEQAPSR